MRRAPLDWLAVALPTIVAALLCAYRLGDRSLWLDEGASLTIASQHGAALWHGIAHDGGNMLAYYLVLHVVIGVFGDSEVAIRMVSLLANAGTAWLVGLLALALFDSRRVAWVAGLLSAVSVSLVFWGQDARGYAAMVTATAASFYALVVLLDPSGDPKGPVSRRAMVGYVLATTAALYIGFDAILVVPAQVLLAVVLKRRRRAVIAALVVVGLASVPLLVLAVNRGSGQLFWVPPLSVTVLWQTLATLLSAGLPPNFHTTAITVIGAVAGSLITVVAVTIAWRARRGPPGSSAERPSPLLVPILWLVVPAAVGVAASAVGEPVELARISILLMPALSLVVAWVLVGPSERLAGAQGSPRRPRVGPKVGIAVLVLLLALRLAALIPSYGETPEPWKGAAAHVIAAAQPGDCVAFYPQDGHMPFGYYVTRTPGAAQGAPRSVLPVQPWSALTPHVEQYVVPGSARVSAINRGCPRVWLIVSHQGQQHGTPESRTHYAGWLATERDFAAVYGRQLITRSGYASAVTVTLYSH